MPFRYTISFTAGGLDEAVLRQALTPLGAGDITVTRSREEQTKIRPSKAVDSILSVLQDGKPHRRRDILAAACSGGLSQTAVSKALVRLAANGQIACLRHGLYGSLQTSLEATTALPTEIDKLSDRSTFRRVVELINEQPQTAAVLREKVQVSRQRMEQILRKAERRKLIQRIKTEFGEIGRFAYVSMNSSNNENNGERESTLLERRKQLLSSMAPDKLYFARELASHFHVAPTSQISNALDELRRLGLVHTLNVGIKLFCGLTSVGAAHRDYVRDAAKAQPVDLVAEIGETKAKYLQAMHVLGGSARTIELTYATAEDNQEGPQRNSGQMMQMLEKLNLVHRPRSTIRQNPYSLTELGMQIAALLNQYAPPPHRALLNARIAKRMETRSDKLRAAVLTNRRKSS